jgi:hypothetical protein
MTHKHYFTKQVAIMLTLFLISTTAFSQREDGIKIRFNGFGDITAGHTFGNPVSKTSDSLFKAYGEDKVPKGTHQGIGLQGLDLVNTVFLNDNFTVQSEVNLQVPRGGTGGPELDVERMYVDYKLSNKLGFQGGLLFTPIGFINRNLYSRAWLMNSVHMFRFVEEESGYVPNHFIGATGYGVFDLSEKHSLKYIVGFGNARGPAPNDNIYARNFQGYQITGLLEWIIQGPKDFRIGISGFSNEVPTYRGLDTYGASILAHDSLKTYLNETGLNPYLHYSGKLFELLAEYHYITYTGPAVKTNSTTALVVELALNTKLKEKRLAPYVRYDFIQTPANNGPYVGIRDNGGGVFSKVYEPDLSIGMVGVAYDVSSFNRIKLEYAHYFTGPYKQNAIVFQTAFGF